VRKSKASSLAFLVVDEDLQLSLMMTSFVLLASESSNRASKEFGNRQPNRIGGLRIRL
jgi:hypothetical protein